MIDLGDLVRDEVTGFTGVVLSKNIGLYEATECRVHPRGLNDNGTPKECVWLFQDRLVVLEKNAVVGFVDIEGKSATSTPVLTQTNTEPS